MKRRIRSRRSSQNYSTLSSGLKSRYAISGSPDGNAVTESSGLWILVGADPTVDHAARSRITIHVGPYHIAQRDVGGGGQLAVFLIEDAADSGAAVGTEGQQRRLVDAAIGGQQ